jgi:DNA-binding transcriptional MerR regulator
MATSMQPHVAGGSRHLWGAILDAVFSTGAFARLAQVSVRTLHHYDEIGLLAPAQVDDRTGYRWYSADQLARLHRILALRDLGFSLGEVQPIVDEVVSLDELRGMLRLRRAEASGRIAAEAERLARVEARLRQIEDEQIPSTYDVVVKPLEPVRLAALRQNAPVFGNDTLGPLFGRLYGELHARLARVSVAPIGPPVALYYDSDDADAPIEVVAALPIGTEDVSEAGVDVLDLPEVLRAVATIHRGNMNRVERGYEALLRWTEQTGERVNGYSREVYLDCDGEPETWVTELQFVLQPRREPPG